MLPIDASIGGIVTGVRDSSGLVIEAEPGAGKTTRVPPALLDAFPGEILVLEPRRLPARMAARRVGSTAGYKVRFEQSGGPGTRLWYMTEGILTRRLLTEPDLKGVSAVVLDEFHERHVETDLALAMLRRLQKTTRPDLRVLAMSATLNSGQLAEYLSCDVIKVPGRVFDVAVSYAGHASVADALGQLIRDGLDGHVLVFLPGAAEIRKAQRDCERIAAAAQMTVLPLHGDLPPAEQDRAVGPSDRFKLILSTNVAESSVTIEGVTAVIDTGLARIASDSPVTGLPTLEVRRIGQASAIQRAGRAGRTQAGRAIRLYSQEDFLRRPAQDVPEIHRRELSQVLLELRAMKIDDLCWLEDPPEHSLRLASELLDRLGADRHASQMARYPLHPRLSRLLIEASQRGVAMEACRVAAHLSSGERSEFPDVLDATHDDRSYRTEQIERQLRRMVRAREDSGNDEALRISLLTAYPDRVARRRSGRDLQLSTGRPAQLTADTAAALLIAIEIEDRKEGAPLVRSMSPVEPEWLLDLYPDRIQDRSEVIWNRTLERTELVSALYFDEIPIDESRSVASDPELLFEKAVEAGLHRWVDPEELQLLLARTEFAASHAPVPRLTDDDVLATLREMCQGLRSFSELETATKDGGFLMALRARLGAHERVLNELAPERLQVGKRLARVSYSSGQAPWIASRLQDFFGMKETPRIARGKVPVVVHLLAPNQRPVQMTSDLAGFWERLYPTVRRELSRRYPKHSWPENPV